MVVDNIGDICDDPTIHSISLLLNNKDHKRFVFLANLGASTLVFTIIPITKKFALIGQSHFVFTP